MPVPFNIHLYLLSFRCIPCFSPARREKEKKMRIEFSIAAITIDDCKGRQYMPDRKVMSIGKGPRKTRRT